LGALLAGRGAFWVRAAAPRGDSAARAPAFRAGRGAGFCVAFVAFVALGPALRDFFFVVAMGA
jgi:hypothetical protein